MSIQLQAEDFDRIVSILSSLPEFKTAQGRVDFITDVFIGTSRKNDIISLINTDGTPRSSAIRLIDRLLQFGQDTPGRETLGILINKTVSYIGSGNDADFLRNLMNFYPFTTLPVADRGVTNWKGTESPNNIQEKIIGENTLRNIYILELALEAAKSVVRIVTPSSLGTGFFIAPNLIMTNNHVIDDQSKSYESYYMSNYQVDRFGNELKHEIYNTKKDGIFYTNRELDFTVIELEKKITDHPPILIKQKRLSPNDRVNIIQHPGGHYKKISFQNNFVAYADSEIVQYTTSTEPGSSGSPVFDDTFQVVAIHHSGGMLVEPNTQHTYLRNAGTSMIAIVKDLEYKMPQVLRIIGIDSM